jgi:tetratricopeptide (TPR) repeat protein
MLKPREAQLLTYCLLITQQLQVVQSDGAYPPRLDPTPSARPAPIGAPPIPEATINAPPPPGGSPAMSFSLRAAVTTSPSFIRPADAGRASPTPPPPPLDKSANACPLSAELAARKAEIIARAASIDREDYFTMLDLDRDATTAEVREKFFALAKVWHPDRIPAALADVRDACSRVFGRMSEAHQTLADEERRGRYMHLLKDGGATPEAQATIASVVEAATNFQKAEICLKRNDLAQAESLVRKAVEADPQQPEYLALAAWLGSLKAENQTPTATMVAIAELDKAIQLSHRCERAYFYRGQLHKRAGNARQAVKDFRKAAELNPRNIDAAREVRLYEMRLQRGSVPPPAPGAPKKGAPEAAKPGGLFGKLFKK